MDWNTIQYALSTIAQSCAALAALVGALGVYRIQSLKDRQAAWEQEIRNLLFSYRASPVWTQRATIDALIREVRRIADRPQDGEQETLTRMRTALAEWDAFDHDFRRGKRLLAIFVGWNLVAIFVSLGGFALIPWLVNRWWSWVGLWVIAFFTVFATGVMLAEAHGSLERFRTWPRLSRVFAWLEEGP